MEVILKIGKKGIIVLPKRIRDAMGVREGDSLIAKIEGRRIILEPFRPIRIRINREIIDKLLEEEIILEKESIQEILKRRESSN
ncbi:MAG: AbrB/MazE/SpoVT family DNA-binding domain-containing protein [Candidatus Njordarchaeales archaeon]